MKKILNILPLCFVAAFLFCVPPVYAHTLKIDRAIGVTLHIDPDDAPLAGVESKLFVEITDSSGRFNSANPSNCECVLTIFSDGKARASLPVVNGGSYAQLRYIFPTSGKYEIEITGKPTRDGQRFQAFTLMYEYYVKGKTTTGMLNPLIAYIPYIQALCGGIIIWMFMSVKRE